MPEYPPPFKATVDTTGLREFSDHKPLQAVNAEGSPDDSDRRLPLYACRVDRCTVILAMWSSTRDVPAIGKEINIRINGVGKATVKGWFVLDGYLGVLAWPHDPPDWWIKQNGQPSTTNYSFAFGTEIDGF